MRILLRSAFPLLLSACIVPWPDAARAQQKFPVKPVRLIVSTTPGSTPEVPSYAESLPNWGRDGTQALIAPAGTPLVIRRQINQELARALELPDIKQRLDAVSFNVAYSTPEQHEKNLRNDIAIFGKIVKEAGLRPNG